MPRRPPPQRGFTLVELGVTVVIMALCAMVVVPAIGNVGRADLRRGANGVAATVRNCYDQAALSGQTYRLTLRAGGSQLRIESTQAAMALDGSGGAVAAAQPLSEGLGGLDLNAGEAAPAAPGATGFLGGLQNLQKLGAQADANAFTKEGNFELPKGVTVFDVWTPEAQISAPGSELCLLFFPDGYTQDALIHLQDSAQRQITVKVAALTGRSRVELGYTAPARPR